MPRPLSPAEAAARQQAKVDAYEKRIAATKARKEAEARDKQEREASRTVARNYVLDAANALGGRGVKTDWERAARVLRLALVEVEAYAEPEVEVVTEGAESAA